MPSGCCSLMGKRITLVAFAWMLTTILFAQADFGLEKQWHLQRVSTQKKGMITLGTWAVGNILVGGVMMNNTKGSSNRFHQMNLFWNVVNLGIATGGYYGVSSEKTASLKETVSQYQKLNQLLLFNAGLDIGYMMTGLYLKEKAKNSQKRQAMYRGYGNSLLLQGGFLFAFDVVLYLINQTSLQEIFHHQNVQILISPATAGIKLEL